MKNGRLSNIALILMLVVGLSLLLYPSFSDYWNSMHQTRAIASYAEYVQTLDSNQYADIWNAAVNYNIGLLNRENEYALSADQKKSYEQILNMSGDGIMGFIEIPTIDVKLPIYHGTDESVLQVAIGHLEWTSLPVGGESTHCVISGHRGLPSARLFTDLDKMGVGDVFMLHVLNQEMTYQVDQVKIVLPHETEDLLIVEGEDYCTLVTCTPYGVNSHRMLVRGKRIDNLAQDQIVHVTADAVIVEKLVVAPFILAPILLIMLIILMIPKRKK